MEGVVSVLAEFCKPVPMSKCEEECNNIVVVLLVG